MSNLPALSRYWRDDGLNGPALCKCTGLQASQSKLAKQGKLWFTVQQAFCKGTTRELRQHLTKSPDWDPPPSLRLVHNYDWLLAQEYLHHKAWVI